MIERAHLHVRPAQLAFWAAAGGVGLAVLVSLVTGGPLLVAAAFVGGAAAPFAWISSRGRAAACGRSTTSCRTS